MKMISDFNFVRGYMKKLLSVILLCVMLVLCGCSYENNKDDTISIVVTAFPHYDFTRQLTKDVDNTEIKMLISPGSEVHTYDPSPSDILSVSSCDLFVFTGGESESWAKNILSSAKNERMRLVSFMEICSPDGKEYAHDHDDHEAAHEHDTEYDEHVWTLPIMSEAVCEHIARELCLLDPENEQIYMANLDEYLAKLRELDTEFSGIMKDAKRNFVVFADRFPFYHFATHYGLEYFSAFPGCSSSTEPSAKTVATLSQKVKEEKLPYVFTIEFSNERIAKTIISGTDAKILSLHSCHNVTKDDFNNGVTYVQLMKKNVDVLREALN